MGPETGGSADFHDAEAASAAHTARSATERRYFGPPDLESPLVGVGCSGVDEEESCFLSLVAVFVWSCPGPVSLTKPPALRAPLVVVGKEVADDVFS